MFFGFCFRLWALVFFVLFDHDSHSGQYILNDVLLEMFRSNGNYYPTQGWGPVQFHQGSIETIST